MHSSIRVRGVNQVADGQSVHNLIESVFIKAQDDKCWMRLISKENCYEMFTKRGLIINDTFLVIFSVEKFWFMDQEVLSEQFVGKLYSEGTGTMKDVCDFFTIEAKARNCSAVIAGSLIAFSSRGIQRLYEREGFTLEGVQMIKVLK